MTPAKHAPKSKDDKPERGISRGLQRGVAPRTKAYMTVQHIATNASPVRRHSRFVGRGFSRDNGLSGNEIGFRR